MSAFLNNVTAPDEFGTALHDAGVLYCPKTIRVRIFVSNQAIYWQRASYGDYGSGGGALDWPQEGEEELLLPLGYSFAESCDALRFRASILKASLRPSELQAQVTVTTRSINDFD